MTVDHLGLGYGGFFMGVKAIFQNIFDFDYLFLAAILTCRTQLLKVGHFKYLSLAICFDLFYFLCYFSCLKPKWQGTSLKEHC